MEIACLCAWACMQAAAQSSSSSVLSDLPHRGCDVILQCIQNIKASCLSWPPHFLGKINSSWSCSVSAYAAQFNAGNWSSVKEAWRSGPWAQTDFLVVLVFYFTGTEERRGESSDGFNLIWWHKLQRNVMFTNYKILHLILCSISGFLTQKQENSSTHCTTVPPLCWLPKKENVY